MLSEMILVRLNFQWICKLCIGVFKLDLNFRSEYVCRLHVITKTNDVLIYIFCVQLLSILKQTITRHVSKIIIIFLMLDAKKNKKKPTV